MKNKIFIALLATAATVMLGCEKPEEEKENIYYVSKVTMIADGEAHEFVECVDLGMDCFIHWPTCQFCMNLQNCTDSINIVDNPEGNPE